MNEPDPSAKVAYSTSRPWRPGGWPDRTWWWLGGLTVVLVAVALPLRSADPPTGDSPQNVTIAWNLRQHGVYSSTPSIFNEPPPSNHRREPTYPTLLAAGMALTTPDDVELSCLLDAEPDCAEALRKLKLINVALLVGLAWSTAALAHVVVGRRWAVLIAFSLAGFNTTFLSDVDQFVNELVAAPLVVFVCLGAYRVGASSRPRRAGAAAGGALGLLMLTKAIWFYLAVPLLVALAVLRWRRRLATPVLAGMAVAVVVAYAVTAPWLARNALTVGTLSPAGGDGKVLAMRAEMATMSWSEYPAAYLVYVPLAGEAVLERFVDREHWHRVPRSNEGSYFRRAHGLAPGGEVSARAGDLRDSDAVRRASLAIIADNPAMSAALTPLFGWRSAIVEVGRTSLADQGTPLAIALSRTLAPLTALWSLTLIPVLAIAAWLALRAGDNRWLLFLLPLAGSYAAHATVTHAVPRYTHPLVPALLVAGLGLLSAKFAEGDE